jgi:hypothetical protein
VEGFCEHGNEPLGSVKVGEFLSSSATGSFSRRAQLHGVIYLFVTEPVHGCRYSYC